jgi:hypothetical protein
MIKPQGLKAIISLKFGQQRLYSGAGAMLLALAGCGDSPPAKPSATLQQGADKAMAAPDSARDSKATEVAAEEQTYASAWGPQVGTQIPRLAATDHTGQAQTLDSLRGENGLLLVFSRSADW